MVQNRLMLSTYVCLSHILLACPPTFGDTDGQDMANTRSTKVPQTQTLPPTQAMPAGNKNEPKPPSSQDEKSSSKKAQAVTETVGQPAANQEGKPPEAAMIFEQPGVLMPKGTLVLEPSVQYVNSSSNRVALSGYTIIPSFTIGLIDVRNVNSNTYVAALAGRYSITNRLEMEVRIPYVYRSDSTSFEPTRDPNGQTIPASVFDVSGSGVGDVEFGTRYQINQPGSDGPFFIANLRAKSNTGKDPFQVPIDPNVTSPSGVPLQTELPTGSGFWAIQPAVTVILPSDPAVLFGTLSYMWNVEREVNGQGRLDPGDNFNFNLGIGIALNEKASFSIGYDHIVLGKPKQNGKEIPGSDITQVASLLLGGSYKLSEKRTLNFSLGAGLTPASPNVQLTLRMPISFIVGGK